MLILVRFSGEISIKARKTRIAFTRRLVDNICAALESQKISFEIKKEWSRIFIETPDGRALDLIARVFGVRTLSVVERIRAKSIEEIIDGGENFFGSMVTGRSFAVRARRAGGVKDPRFPSKEIEKHLGARLLRSANRVDLTRPEVTASIEIHGDEVYFFTQKVSGPGGLPLNTDERALALISGGFDSAVAAWQILKRGVALDYLFLNLGGNEHLASMLPVLKALSDRWNYGDRPRLFVIDFQPVVQELESKTDARYWQVILKRLMLRAAERVAASTQSFALVTGEAIGQVSSQTLPNLQVISMATTLPILRPLISFDKHEIIERAREIGTALFSEKVAEYCALTARHPATSASLPDVLEQEEDFDLAILERAIAEHAELDLSSLDAHLPAAGQFEIHEIPADALVIDLRSFSSYMTWHYPRAMHLDFFQALNDIDALKLPLDKKIVAYCEIGVKSAQFAERLRKRGIAAHHFAGGMRSLMGYAIERELVPIELLPPSAWPD